MRFHKLLYEWAIQSPKFSLMLSIESFKLSVNFLVLSTNCEPAPLNIESVSGLIPTLKPANGAKADLRLSNFVIVMTFYSLHLHVAI